MSASTKILWFTILFQNPFEVEIDFFHHEAETHDVAL